MSDITTPGSTGQRGRAPSEDVLITTAAQLRPHERELIERSQREAEHASDGLPVADVWPRYKVDGQLRGVLECERCGRLHEAGLALDGDFVRHSQCAHRLCVSGSYRQRWQLPEFIPANVTGVLQMPDDDGWTLDAATALRSGARWMRERGLRYMPQDVEERFVRALQRGIRTEAFKALLAERLDGSESRRHVSARRRMLLGEIASRHSGRGRPSVIRSLEAAAAALEHAHRHGTPW